MASATKTKPFVIGVIIVILLLNIVAGYFILEGYFVSPGFKTISRLDVQKLLIVDVFVVIWLLVREYSLKKR